MLLCAQAATNRALSQRPFQCLMCYMMRLSKSSGFCHLAAEKHKTKTWYVKGYLFYMSCSLHCAASEAVRAKTVIMKSSETSFFRSLYTYMSICKLSRTGSIPELYNHSKWLYGIQIYPRNETQSDLLPYLRNKQILAVLRSLHSQVCKTWN